MAAHAVRNPSSSLASTRIRGELAVAGLGGTRVPRRRRAAQVRTGIGPATDSARGPAGAHARVTAWRPEGAEGGRMIQAFLDGDAVETAR
jgi:hypothetical protein